MNTLVSSGGSVTTLRHLNVLIAASNFPIAGELAPSLYEHGRRSCPF
jgi:hypothetical protein